MFFLTAPAMFVGRAAVHHIGSRVKDEVGGRIGQMLGIAQKPMDRAERIAKWYHTEGEPLLLGALQSAAEGMASLRVDARGHIRENHFGSIKRAMLSEVNAALVDLVEDVRADAERRAPKRYGTYAKSIQGRVEGGKGYVYTTDFRANWLERGTRHHPAYPHLVPAAEAARGKVESRMKRALQAGARRGGR